MSEIPKHDIAAQVATLGADSLLPPEKPRKVKIFNSEAKVKAEVRKLLDAHKWFWWMPPANAYGKTGVSDFNSVKSGVFMAIETKFNNNKPTAMQKGYLSSVASQDCFAFVVDEKNIVWLAIWLIAFDKSVQATQEEREVAKEDGAAMLNAIRELTKGY